MRWWRLPIWTVALLTGAKSFADNPILGSKRLNRAGLHVWRLRAAHWLAWSRRARLCKLLPQDLREQFDRDGFVAIRDFLPPEEFQRLRSALLHAEFESREHWQGDTVTRRVAVGPKLLQQVPELAQLLENPLWKGVLAYIGSTRSVPLYYIQTISAGHPGADPDPQVELHSDTFHPTLKAWLFLTDVDEADRPLTFVAGSHLLTDKRRAWEQRKSAQVLDAGDRLSQRGSFRIGADELPELGLPPATRFAVRANTLVAADTCGFHARGHSSRPTLRVEVWAYGRRTPFLPWTGLDLLSWRPVAMRRAEWLGSIVDWLSKHGLMTQHWRAVGLRRPIDP